MTAETTPRNLPRLTAGNLDLASTCPGSHALPHVRRAATEKSERGAAVHDFVTRALAGDYDDALANVPAVARDTCKWIDVDELDGFTRPILEDERYLRATLAWDPASGKAAWLPAGEPRDYRAVPEGSVIDTADVLTAGTKGGTEVRVTDIYTGSNLTPPRDDWRMRFLGYVAAQVFNSDVAVLQTVSIDEDGEVTTYWDELNARELAEIGDDLRRVHRQVESAREGSYEFTVGAHCGHCPAFHACPVQAGTAQSIMDEKLDELTPERVAEIWPRLQAVKKATKQVQDVLTDYVIADPVPLSNGKELRVTERQTEEYLPGPSMRVLRELMGSDEAVAEAVAVTKSSLKNAISPEVMPEVIRRIRDEGGVRTKTSSGGLREVKRRD